MKSSEIFFDEEAMHKVITNLLSNAIKFTPDGGSISIYIATLPAKVDKEEKLYLCVSDTGTGIQEQDTAQIFNRFYQSKKQAKYPVYGQTVLVWVETGKSVISSYPDTSIDIFFQTSYIVVD